MRNETLIAETGRFLASLSEAQAQSVRDFAAFLAQQTWDNLPIVAAELDADETEADFAADMRIIQQQSRAYDFLNEEK
ncbi:hypothetical protein [Hymenobacter ruricola]|uniref:DUF2281 domain-containing protein n=1 Tax=Hymenobacter ruricola TaxID=2791023 RepID=A0ABS0I6J1_9BACT|nr:hypothetical protein [Hymenobacter ruricola]MBF9222560.1 hypothetical protein [Hymenobacter ruricola]